MVALKFSFVPLVTFCLYLFYWYILASLSGEVLSLLNRPQNDCLSPSLSRKLGKCKGKVVPVLN